MARFAGENGAANGKLVTSLQGLAKGWASPRVSSRSATCSPKQQQFVSTLGMRTMQQLDETAASKPPEQAEAGAMPAQNGLRLDDGDRATPRRKQARAEKQLEPIDQVELRALAAASQNIDLVARVGTGPCQRRRQRARRTTSSSADRAGS